MNITDYFVIFYAENKPIADFDFSHFSDSCYYICPCIKNGKFRSFTVYTYDCEYSIEIPRYDYHVYWPVSLLRLYNRLVFHHNIKSPSIYPHKYHSAYYEDYHFDDYGGVYEIWRDDDRVTNHRFYSKSASYRYNDHHFNRFRSRFKAIIVMK